MGEEERRKGEKERREEENEKKEEGKRKKEEDKKTKNKVWNICMDTSMEFFFGKWICCLGNNPNSLFV